MADPNKCRIGQHISVTVDGETIEGYFGGIIPAVPGHRLPRARVDRIIVRDKSNECTIAYVPYIKGTTFKHVRKRRASS